LLIKLEQLLEGIENSSLHEIAFENLELKSQWEQKHGKSISAFANNIERKIGFIVIGVDDEGNLTKKKPNFLKDTEHEIANHINQYLSPPSSVQNIQSKEFENSAYIIITIKNPGDVTEWNGKAYKRIGAHSIEMTSHEKLALSLKLPGQDFSKNDWEGTVTNTLVLEFATKLVERDYSTLPKDLSKISVDEILKKIDCRNKIAAKILFGDTPVRIAYFDNNGDIINQISKNGAFYLLSDSFVEEIQTWTKSKGTLLEKHSISVIQELPYPPKALRECLANAVSHALYERHLGDLVVELHPSRIVIKNNCSLDMEGFSKEWFSKRNCSKNKFLMQLLREAGFTDELGTGKMRLYSQMLEAGKQEPLIEFYERGNFGCWAISLYNELNNECYLKLFLRFKEIFKTIDEARLAIALILWRNNTWPEILEKLDLYYQKLALEIVESSYSPIIVVDNTILLKRWATVALEGQYSRAFTSHEEEQIRKIIETLAFSEAREGKFTATEARAHIGLSKTPSENTQLSNLFRRWKKDNILTQGKKRGEWIYMKKPINKFNIIFPKDFKFDPRFFKLEYETF
jgi:predicted HTH transcriptional regulator